jgi:glycosyltransferase involved in cell wall biosynthesis
LRLVPNGVTPPAIRRDREGELVVGTVARLARQKGIEYLFRVAERTCAKRSGVRFSVVGGGPSMEPLERELERRRLCAKFELLGEVKEIWEYLEQVAV